MEANEAMVNEENKISVTGEKWSNGRRSQQDFSECWQMKQWWMYIRQVRYQWIIINKWNNGKCRQLSVNRLLTNKTMVNIKDKYLWILATEMMVNAENKWWQWMLAEWKNDD